MLRLVDDDSGTFLQDIGVHLQNDLLDLQKDRKPLKWLETSLLVPTTVYDVGLTSKKGGHEKNFHGLGKGLPICKRTDTAVLFVF